MKYRLSIVAACLLFAGVAFGEGPAVSANHVWIRSAPAGVEALSGFMTLENLTDKPLQITSITSSDFGAVMLTSASASGETQDASAVKNFVLPPHQPVVFKQDGAHLQLIKPHRRLYDGDMVTLLFNFSDGSSLDLLAPVRRDAPANN